LKEGKVTCFRNIAVDFDVHKAIENERRGFTESPNDALRRLLKLPPPATPSKLSAPPPPAKRSWSDKGVTLSSGTELRMKYNRRTYEGVIVNGEWVIGSKKFDSPSGAASGVAITKNGGTTKLDGWKYWYVKAPGEDKWTLIDDLRPETRPILTPEDIENLFNESPSA
jgi:hypothetical protein